MTNGLEVYVSNGVGHAVISHTLTLLDCLCSEQPSKQINQISAMKIQDIQQSARSTVKPLGQFNTPSFKSNMQTCNSLNTPKSTNYRAKIATIGKLENYTSLGKQTQRRQTQE